MTKEICSWLPALHKQTTSPSCPSNQCGSQEHISLITDVLFLMNLHSSTNSNTNSTNAWLCFDIIICYDWPFLHVCTLQGNLQFSSLILSLLFSKYVGYLWGYQLSYWQFTEFSDTTCATWIRTKCAQNTQQFSSDMNEMSQLYDVQSTSNALRVVVAPFCKRQARQLHPLGQTECLHTVLNRLQTITTTTASASLPCLSH